MAVGGQQHGMVTLDADGAPGPGRAAVERQPLGPDAIDLVAELGGPQAWADQVGSVPPASFTVTKLRWLARAEPENAARTAAVLLPHDWLTWQLGGRRSDPATDRGDASGTGYFDATANAYRDDLVRLALGHDLRLPTVAAPDAVVGETPDGIRLAPGTGDNMAAGLGLGLDPRDGRGLARHQRHGLHHQRHPEPRPDGHGGGVRRRHRRVPAAGLHAERRAQPVRHRRRCWASTSPSSPGWPSAPPRAAGDWPSCPTWRGSGRRRCPRPPVSWSGCPWPTWCRPTWPGRRSRASCGAWRSGSGCCSSTATRSTGSS